MKTIKQLLREWLEKTVEEASLRLLNLKIDNDLNKMYQEAGKDIEEISWRYPATYRDATIIFEEWCKGLLTECRPDEEALRNYSTFTARPSEFQKWRYRSGGFRNLFSGLTFDGNNNKSLQLYALINVCEKAIVFDFPFSNETVIQSLLAIGGLWPYIAKDAEHEGINRKNIEDLVGIRLTQDFYDLMETIAANE